MPVQTVILMVVSCHHCADCVDHCWTGNVLDRPLDPLPGDGGRRQFGHRPGRVIAVGPLVG